MNEPNCNLPCLLPSLYSTYMRNIHDSKTCAAQCVNVISKCRIVSIFRSNVFDSASDINCFSLLSFMSVT